MYWKKGTAKNRTAIRLYTVLAVVLIDLLAKFWTIGLELYQEQCRFFAELHRTLNKRWWHFIKLLEQIVVMQSNSKNNLTDLYLKVEHLRQD